MREWRVSWKRERGSARRKLYQTEAGARRYALILQGRMTEAFPDINPDEKWCCSGYQCNCEGKTWAIHWQQRHEDLIGSEWGPGPLERLSVESREVGIWEEDT